MQHQIVALCSHKETGKSTLANMTLSLLTEDWVYMGETKISVKTRTAPVFGITSGPYAFADGIKDSLACTLERAVNTEIVFYGAESAFYKNRSCSPAILHSLLYGSMKNYKLLALDGITPRQLMQKYGTDFVRKWNDDFWALATFSNLYQVLISQGSLHSNQSKPDTFSSIALIDDLRENVELRVMEENCAKHNIIFTPVVLARDGVSLSDTHSSETIVSSTMQKILDKYPDNFINVRHTSKPKDLECPANQANLEDLRTIIRKARNRTDHVVHISTLVGHHLERLKNDDDND